MRIKYLIFLVIIFFLKNSYSGVNEKWTGEWLALDQWKSEFIIILEENGFASSDYGDGQKGFWEIVDGNVIIKWDSGKEDFIL